MRRMILAGSMMIVWLMLVQGLVVPASASTFASRSAAGAGGSEGPARIAISVLPDLGEQRPADGAVVNGAVFVFVDTPHPERIVRVEWTIGGRPAGVDRGAPFTLGGDRRSLSAWDTTLVVDGVHPVTARVVYGDERPTLEARLVVSNGSAPASEGLVAALGDDPGNDPGDIAMFTVVRAEPANRLCFRVRTRTAQRPRATHVQRGRAGERGPVFIDLRTPVHPYRFVDGAWLSEGCVSLSEESTVALVADPAANYLNVTTAAFPFGARRGQLVTAPATSLVVPLEGPGAIDGRAALGVVDDIVCHSVVTQGARPRRARLRFDGGGPSLDLGIGSGTLGLDGFGAWSLTGCAHLDTERLQELILGQGSARVELDARAPDPDGGRRSVQITGVPAVPRTALVGASTVVASFELFEAFVCYRVVLGDLGELESLALVPTIVGDPRIVLGAQLDPPIAEGSRFATARGCRRVSDTAAVAARPGTYSLELTTDRGTTSVPLR